MNRQMSTIAVIFGMLLCAGVAWAGPPLNVGVTLVGPDEGFAEQGLDYTATGGFDLDGDTQTEVANGEATVEEEYAWSYAPASCDTAPATGPVETFRFSPDYAPGEYTIMVTYTVTLRYKNGTTDQDWDCDSIQVAVLTSGLCVLIVEPDADPFVVIAGEEQEFEAVAWLDGVELASEDVTWSWSFGDNTPLSTDNPTVHTYEDCGGYTVTVTATYLGLQAQDAAIAQANPQEATDFEFFARCGIERVDDGGEICDGTQLVVRTAAGHQFTARFYGRLPNGEWSQWPPDGGAPHFEENEGGVHYDAASPTTLPTPCGRNGTGQNRVEVCIEQGAEDPPIVLNLYLALTANNTVVKDTTEGTGVIRHDPADPTHAIEWNISHKDLEGDAPKFDVDVEIRALTGGEPLVTLHNTNVSLGAGGCEWDGKIEGFEGMEDAPKGIYTYKIIAGHGTDVGDCDDRDKSERLGIDVRKLYGAYNAEAQRLTWVVVYGLNRDASQVKIQLYGPDLELLHEAGGQPNRRGENWSQVFYDLSVPKQENGQPVAPLYCVVSALEDSDSAVLNRDGMAKPALQDGTTNLEPFPFDLHVDGASEDQEESVGAFVLLNNDDDDKDGTQDLSDPVDPGPPVANEDDLKRVVVSWNPEEVDEGTLILSCTAGGDNIKSRVYREEFPAGWQTLPLTMYPDDPNTVRPQVLWVEGCVVSGAVRDVELELKWVKNDEVQLDDVVKLTVWDAEIDECDGEWIPAGTPQNPTHTTATCRIKPSDLQGYIMFGLSSSQEPGYCMNAPVDQTEPGYAAPDLAFTPDQEGFALGTDTFEGAPLPAAATTAPTNEATVQLDCADYGAWGTVRATVRVGDTRDRAHIPGDWAKHEPTFPRDEDENPNCIADAWPHNAGEATDDAEAIAGKGHPDYPGDGLSRYEEYRGFIAMGEHMRTNPDADKDLFISDRDGIHDIIGGWEDITASGVTVREILETEYLPAGQPLNDDAEKAYPPGRQINSNHGFAHVRDQFAPKVIERPDTGQSALGVSYRLEGSPGVPHDCVLIVVYTRKIKVKFGDDDPATWEAVDLAALRSILGHEVGHGMGLAGHGPAEASGARPGEDVYCVMYSPLGEGNIGHHYCTTAEEDCLNEWRLW